ncbi:hypothetical protein ARMGADRAFT_103417 [Armillaria gallica]|uniref:Uncharacterized protein n=1 Tax=Armillaria gallica TaxID=47427 RepID=A0A2H3CD30_ARMGA|nr:hypothetical protein ARMGADRAFT_103417 [Armillaria gallica]
MLMLVCSADRCYKVSPNIVLSKNRRPKVIDYPSLCLKWLYTGVGYTAVYPIITALFELYPFTLTCSLTINAEAHEIRRVYTAPNSPISGKLFFLT